MILTRTAIVDDIDYIVDLSSRVQAKLTASGSLQEIGPIPHDVVADYVKAGAVCILENGIRQGSVFVRPIEPASFDSFFTWELDKLVAPVYFLSKLMIEPDLQGHGLGAILLRDAVGRFAECGSGTLTLDCWAGNDKLRAFYTQHGFQLYGIYPEADFEVAVFFRLPSGKNR